MAKSLYICYFGVREPLVQTQVIPYLREIIKDGVKMSLLTFEPDLKKTWTREQIEAEKSTLAAQGITWNCLAYHKRPSALATAYDIIRGSLVIRRLIASEQIDILHGRVFVPTLMAALARKLSRRKPKLLFDIRGFFPEEYADAGIWPENGWLYSTAKRIDRWLMRESDGFVVLTAKAQEILFPESAQTGFDKQNRPVEVIPCCVDMKRFEAVGQESRAEIRKKLHIEDDRFVMVYVGSFGGWYLTDEMIELFAAAREGNSRTFTLILTQRDNEKIAQKLREKGFASSEFLIKTLPPSDIPMYLKASDVAVSFIKACYSKLSSSPTKMAEYLICGLPLICNRGVGDVDMLIDENRVGAMVEDFSSGSYLEALHEIAVLGDIRQRCRETALREFDLEYVGGPRYRSLYRKLMDTQ